MTIMGVHGIDERAGLTTPNLLEAETNRAFVDSARRLVVIADNTKWGVVGLSQIATLEAVSTLVTDDKLPQAAVTLLRDRVGEVICVPGRDLAVTQRRRRALTQSPQRLPEDGREVGPFQVGVHRRREAA